MREMIDKIQKINTYLPVFPGFYNTIFEGDEELEIDFINQERRDLNLPELTWFENDIEFAYDVYQENVCEVATQFIEDRLFDLELIESIEFEGLVSPKWYNYSNDSININITLDPEKLSIFINERWEEFTEYLRDTYTSCDGFIPSFSNDPEKWKENTNNFTENLSGHILGSLLQFVCEVSNITKENMHYSLELYLSVEDVNYEINKIKCPECDRWFVNTDIIKNWNDQIDKDFISKEYFEISPKLRDFDEWLMNNYIHCGCI